MFEITLIHPKLVHFTIALFSLAVLLDIIGVFSKNEKFHWASWVNLIFAGVAVAVTAFSGWLAANNVPHNDAVHEMMETHETLGYIVLGIILLLLFWRIILKGKFPGKAAWLYIGIGLAGLGVMFTGANYGGEMVYTHGVAVKAVPQQAHDHSNGGHSHGEEAAGHHDGENELHGSGTESVHSHSDTDAKNEGHQVKENVHKHTNGSAHIH